MESPKILFSNYDRQKKILIGLCDELLNLICASESTKGIFFKDLTEFLTKVEKNFIVDKHIDQKRLKNDILLIGSPGKFSNRLLSFSAASQGITFMDACTVLNVDQLICLRGDMMIIHVVIIF